MWIYLGELRLVFHKAFFEKKLDQKIFKNMVKIFRENGFIQLLVLYPIYRYNATPPNCRELPKAVKVFKGKK
jgi:hypothetical protein